MKRYNIKTKQFEVYEGDLELLAFQKLAEAGIPCEYNKDGIIIDDEDEQAARGILEDEQ